MAPTHLGFATISMSNSSLERYKQSEDMIQIPFHEEMGDFNKTVLRCSDGVFKINVTDLNNLKLTSKR